MLLLELVLELEDIAEFPVPDADCERDVKLLEPKGVFVQGFIHAFSKLTVCVLFWKSLLWRVIAEIDGGLQRLILGAVDVNGFGLVDLVEVVIKYVRSPGEEVGVRELAIFEEFIEEDMKLAVLEAGFGAVVSSAVIDGFLNFLLFFVFEL